jgi:hypothetical protein
MTITARYPSTCSRCGGRIQAGVQIEWDRDTRTAAHSGSCPQNPEPAPTREHSSIEVLTPSEDTRAGRMLLAGELTVTMSADGDEHATFYLRCLVTPDRSATGEWERTGWDDPQRIVLVSAAKRGQRIGRITADRMVFRDDVHADTRAAFVLLMDALGGKLQTREVLPSEDEHRHGLYVGDRVVIQAAGYCGACGRELKRPESIDLGLGPECSGKGHRQYTGKGHVQVREDVAPEPRPGLADALTHSDVQVATRAQLATLEAHTPERAQATPTPAAVNAGAAQRRLQAKREADEHNAVLRYIERADADTLAHLKRRIVDREHTLRGR